MTVERAGPSGARGRRAGGAVGRTGPSGGRVRRADGAAERAGPSGYTTLRAGNLVVGGAKMHSTVPQRAIWPLRRSRVHFPHTVTTGAPLQSRPIPRRGHHEADKSSPAGLGYVRVTRPGMSGPRDRTRQGHPARNARPPGRERQATRPSTRRPRTGNATATWPGTPGPPGRARQGHATRHTRPTRSGTRGRRLRWATPGAGCSGLGRERPRTPPAAARSAPSSPRARPHRPGPRRR